MRPHGPTDRLIGELATRQHGVVSRHQLLASGVGGRAISRRLAAGRLHTVHRGVYAVGHRVLGPHGRWLAAVLACGDGAVLSHASAAAAWRIRPPKAGGTVDVTVPGDAGRKRAGIRAHRVRLHPEDVTTLAAIRITTPSRTLIDLATTYSSRQIEQALDETRYLRLLDRTALDAAMARASRGARALERVLADHVAGTTRTRSNLEEAFLALIRSAALPQPVVNAKVGRMTVDFLWSTQRVIVETDGHAYHDSPRRRRRDARRDALLRSWRYDVIRVAEADLRERPLAVIGLVASALG